MYTHSASIVDIAWTKTGFISVDANGLAIKWGLSYGELRRWNLNSSVIDISVTSTWSYTYVAFNFGDRV